MASNRIGRINEEIQRELASLLRNLKDPRVQSTMISITRVETTPDLRYAKVYVSFLDKGKGGDALKGLRSAGGYLRLSPAGRLGASAAPLHAELQWQEDDSITRGAHMLDLLNSLHIAKDDEHESSDHS